MSTPVLSESDPLLPETQRQHQPTPNHYWRRPHPQWLIPLALISSLARGLTLAARVQIVTRIACDSLHRASRATLDPTQYLQTTESTISAIPDVCFTDPAVQASAAQAQMILTVISGGVTALTAGRWGKWGDKSGRNKVMSVALLGLVMAESVYALVSLRHLPLKHHGHKLILLAPIFEGLFGSWPTLQANMNAYLSDITPQGSAARMFSRFMGILYIGFAVGPSIASFVLRQSATKNLTPLFIMSAVAYSISLLFILLIAPESLHSSDKPPSESSSNDTHDTHVQNDPETAMWRPIRRLIAPLAAFRPRRAGAMRKDYTLTIIALSYFTYLMSLALYQLKYLYAEHVFSWDAERLGYYISYMGFARAITLLVLMPAWNYLFKPLPIRGRSSVSPRRELNFDLSLVRMSILLDVLSHASVIVAPSSSATWFVLATTLTSLGSTSVPSYSSTVLGYVRYRTAQAEQEDQQEDVGVLFGGLAVLQSLGQTIIGPILFGLVYSATVSTFPKGVFVLACSLAGMAFVLMLIARPRKRLILVGTHRDGARGRSGMPKPITIPPA